MPLFKSHSWRRWLVLVTLLLLSAPRVDSFATTRRIIFQAAVTLVLGAWLVSLMIRRRPFPATRLDIPLLLFFTAATVSTIFAVDPRVSVEGLWRLGWYILFFHFAVDWMRTYGTRTLIEPIFFFAALLVTLGVVEVAFRYVPWFEIGGFTQPLPPQVPRLVGMLSGNPNTLVAYLAPVIPVLLAWGLSLHSREQRLALFAAAAGSFVLAGLTLSRGGFLALAAGLALLAVLLIIGIPALRARVLQAARDRRVIAAGVIALLTGLPLLIHWVTARSWSMDAARLDLWRSAWLAGLSQPLTGVGPAGYGRARRLYGDPWLPIEHHNHTHNVPLQAWADGGLLGVLVVGVMVGALVAAAVAHWRRAEGPSRIRLAGVAAGLAGFATHSLVETFFGAVPNNMAIVFMAVTLAAYVVAPLERAPRWPSVQRLAAPVILGLLLVSAAGWAVSHRAQALLDRSVELAQGGDLPGAVEAIRAAQRLDPHMGFYTAQEAQYLGELALHDPAYLSAARQAFEAALADEGTSATLHANYAAVLAAAGDEVAARRALQAAINLEPDDGEYPLWSGVLAEGMGDAAGARAAYVEALVLEPDWLASGFWDLSPLRQEARAAFLAAYELDGIPLDTLIELPPACWPTDAPPHWHGWRGPGAGQQPYCEGMRALVLDADPAQALPFLNQAVEVEPGLAAAYTARAEARLALGEHAAAEHDLRVAKYLGDTRAAYRLGVLAEHRSDLASAEQHYLGATVRLVPLYEWAGAVYQRFGLIEPLPGLEMPAPTNLDPHLALLRLYETQERIEDAARVREAIIDLDPSWQARDAARQPDPLDS